MNAWLQIKMDYFHDKEQKGEDRLLHLREELVDLVVHIGEVLVKSNDATQREINTLAVVKEVCDKAQAILNQFDNSSNGIVLITLALNLVVQLQNSHLGAIEGGYSDGEWPTIYGRSVVLDRILAEADVRHEAHVNGTPNNNTTIN